MNKLTANSESSNISSQAAAQYWQAALHRDPRADGKFFLAVRSTHIYCRPTCPARRPLRQNAVFFRTTQEAEKNGYRPCRRCRPQEQLESISLVKQAAKLLGSASEEDSIRLGSIAAQLNASTAKLRRVFHRVTGLSPREFAHAARLEKFKKMLLGATRTYTQVAHALGKPNAVRAVARACATNPTSIVVPCHRVIRTDGELAGYRWGLQRKQKLLQREGARA